MLQKLKTAEFLLHIKPNKVLKLPPYKGATIRGGLGITLKKIVCAVKNTDCSNCLLREKCIYLYLFETPVPKDSEIMRKYREVPHPFVIVPPLGKQTLFQPGEEIVFSLVLIGSAIEYLPYFIYAFDELGRNGMGNGKENRTTFKLEKVTQKNNNLTLYSGEEKKLYPGYFVTTTEALKQPADKNLKIRFITPTRIKFQEKLTVDLEFHILVKALARRLFLLSHFHCKNTEKPDFSDLFSKAAEIKIDNRKLKWDDWERYSTRQKKRMKLGGFVGDITFTGEMKPFNEILRWGEIVHVGKGTGFGLGRYEIAEFGRL